MKLLKNGTKADYAKDLSKSEMIMIHAKDSSKSNAKWICVASPLRRPLTIIPMIRLNQVPQNLKCKAKKHETLKSLNYLSKISMWKAKKHFVWPYSTKAVDYDLSKALKSLKNSTKAIDYDRIRQNQIFY